MNFPTAAAPTAAPPAATNHYTAAPAVAPSALLLIDGMPRTLRPEVEALLAECAPLEPEPRPEAGYPSGMSSAHWAQLEGWCIRWRTDGPGTLSCAEVLHHVDSTTAAELAQWLEMMGERYAFSAAARSM